MAIDDDIAFLERVPTLGLLGRAALRILAIGAETRHVHGGEVLFNAGDEAEGGFVVQAGRFQLSSSEDGKDLTVGPCTLLGEVALFAETKRPATAKALEPATVLIIPRPLFIRMLDSFPDAARKLRETLAGRLDQATREIVNVRDFLDAHEPK
ncbi:MAG TPA: Crp/Fnr family transcriptional regulator [Xanthobacteraceae bacterium]|jgi:CRP-like cAMP-binding protein|nr:Crp/Fnr family transcriptional regulator [Xanthobacteraceae bacterium]